MRESMVVIRRTARAGDSVRPGVVFGRALWKGLFTTVVAAGVAFFTVGWLAGIASYSLWASVGVTLLVALPAGLFAFLWALRPEAGEKD